MSFSIYFQDFLWLFFSVVWIWYSPLCVLVFVLFGVLWNFCPCGLSHIINFGKFSFIIFFKYFFHLLSFISVIPVMCVLECLILSQCSCMLCFIFNFSLFSSLFVFQFGLIILIYFQSHWFFPQLFWVWNYPFYHAFFSTFSIKVLKYKL